MGPITDVHHHYVPLAMAQARGFRPGQLHELMDGDQPFITLHDRLCDLDRQLGDMDVAGLDTAILSCFFGWDGTEGDCRTINDDLAGITQRYGGRFFGYAHVPLHDTVKANAELRRTINSLGLCGVTITSQVNGRQLDDPSLFPFYECVCELQAPIFVHPVMRVEGHRGADQYQLGRIIGREFDLITAMSRVIASGLLDRFPDLRFIFSHLGGGIASIKERLSRSSFRWNLPRSFAEYFDTLYVDTSGCEGGTNALRCALTGIRPDRMVFGSDYPQLFASTWGEQSPGVNGVRRYADLIREMTGDQAGGILSGNLAQLFKR